MEQVDDIREFQRMKPPIPIDNDLVPEDKKERAPPQKKQRMKLSFLGKSNCKNSTEKYAKLIECVKGKKGKHVLVGP